MKDIQAKSNVIDCSNLFKENSIKLGTARFILKTLGKISRKAREYVLYEIGDHYCFDCGAELEENDYHDCIFEDEG